MNAPDLHRYQREALKDATWGLSRTCVRLRGGGDNHRAAANQPEKSEPVQDSTEWDSLMHGPWKLVGRTTDPLLKGVSLLTTDGGSEFVDASLARRRGGMEPHR